MSPRMKEKSAIVIVSIIAVYAATVLCWFLRQEGEWKKTFKAYERAVERYKKESNLISERGKWNDEYDEEKSRMPIFSEDEDTVTKCLRKLGDIAQKNNVFIDKRQNGTEIKAGDVWEMPIDVRDWEGALEMLVKFLYELENTDEGMFNLSKINFKPSQKPGYFKGSFTLNCAYMRED